MVRAGRRGERAKALSLGWGEDTDPRTAPLLPGEPGAYGTHGVTRDVASGDSADPSGAASGPPTLTPASACLRALGASSPSASPWPWWALSPWAFLG